MRTHYPILFTILEVDRDEVTARLTSLDVDSRIGNDERAVWHALKASFGPLLKPRMLRSQSQRAFPTILILAGRFDVEYAATFATPFQPKAACRACHTCPRNIAVISSST